MLSSRALKPAVPFLGAALALVAAGLLAGCDRQSGGATQPQASATPTSGAASGAVAPSGKQGAFDRGHKGSRPPQIMLKDAGGRRLTLASLAGKPVLLNLWATWCAPCVTELPMLDKLAKDGTVRVVTVSQDMGDPGKVGAFLTGRGITTLEPWLDPNNDLSFHYGTGTLPTSILYDAQGREAWRLVGERDWTLPDTAAILAETGS